MFQSRDLFSFEVDPIKNFLTLYEEVLKHQKENPAVMTLATVDTRGRPDARVVFLDQVKGEEFIFFTSYNSTKASELETTPFAALVFYWHPLNVQVRILGSVLKVDRANSKKAFAALPRNSQLGAWASQQSEAIESFEHLVNKFNQVSEEFADKRLPCPEHWGGYRVCAEIIEFWFGMAPRLDERFVYEKSGDHWLRVMKAP